jgi:excisionase family DNA binding protein
LAVLSTPHEQLLTVAQDADQLQVTPQTIRNWIEGGTLPAVRIGRGFRVRRSDVDELLDQARAESGSLATRRDVWAPTTTTLPRHHDPGEPQSVWADTETPQPLKRS